jgi:radical SAM superfamily enzyme YgiQ (UPF0313 family)
VCLVYPNTYAVAMANLGFQAVLKILATTPGVICERSFLVGATQAARSLESERSLADFDIVAFSLSFESDYPNIVRILDAAGIPARSARRRDGERAWPLLVAGGPATFLNPEPIAPFFDLFLIGEGEEMIPEAFAGAQQWAGVGFDGLLERLASVEGAYRPHHGERDGADISAAGRLPVKRRYLSDLDAAPATSSVVAPDAVFGGHYLVESSRGCEWGCRFCAAGFMYRPVRHRSNAGIIQDSLAGLEYADTIGLVGAELASHPGLPLVCERVSAGGGRVSPSSLKADMISPRLAAALGRGGTRSVTVAPEAGSERMRRVINKNLTEGEIMRAADLVVGDGVESLKLYFMCALPTETDEDVDAIYDLTEKIRGSMMGHGRRRGRVGRIKVAVNPFVPKPWTPFQWDAMLEVSKAQRKIAGLRRRLGRLANVDFDSESPREAYLQTLLSRGDRRVASVVEALARGDGGWWHQLQAMRKGEHPGVDFQPDEFVYREYDYETVFPWDFIDHHIDRDYLWLERRRALSGRETEPCDVSTCTTCGAC